MSKTDQHLPYRVRLLNPGDVVEHHDHRHGSCDLPSLRDYATRPDLTATRCRWDLTLAAYYTSPTCGCPLCTGHLDRRAARRRDRKRARQELNRELAHYRNGLPAEDDTDCPDCGTPEWSRHLQWGCLDPWAENSRKDWHMSEQTAREREAYIIALSGGLA